MRALTALASAILVTVLTAGVGAAPPPGDRLVDQVQQAYRETDQYQSTMRLEIRQVQGRWATVRSAEFHIAYDRPNERLMFDGPDMQVVVRDGRLHLRSDSLPNRHLDTAAPSPLSYDALMESLPMLVHVLPLELAFLLSDDPVAALADGQPAHVETQAPAADDAAERPRLQLIVPPTTSITMTLAAETGLIEQAVLIDAVAENRGPGDSFAIHFDYDVQRHNEAIDEAVFEFDPPANSTAVASLQELLQGGGGGGRGRHWLEGREAPPVELETLDGEAFSLDDVEAEVIVLDFSATWSPACWEGLRMLQQVHEWAEDGERSVAIYAVNQEETVEEVGAHWEREGLTMPVLMDTAGEVGAAYMVATIPQTVVIQGGEVRHVHRGAEPGMDDQLKQEITALLAEE